MRQLALMLALCGAAGTAAAEGAFAGKVTATQLRLRAGPGESYQDLLMVEEGALLVVIGRHANSPEWYQVELPDGYPAWVFGSYVARAEDGTGTVTADRVLLRPRPSTRYHQLAGALQQGEKLVILGEEAGEGGTWLRVKAPRRIPLFAHSKYVENAGPPELAEKPAEPAAAPEAVVEEPEEEATPAEPVAGDARVVEIAALVEKEIEKGRREADLEPLKRALHEIDRAQLSSEMREQRLALLTRIFEAEKRFAVEGLRDKEREVTANLEQRLQEIEREHQRRLEEIRKKFREPQQPRFVATGIVAHRPDLFGRHPSFRLEEGGKIRYYLIAPDFDLNKFEGKRVGVAGLLDAESGTGCYTVMVNRIEILGDR